MAPFITGPDSGSLWALMSGLSPSSLRRPSPFTFGQSHGCWNICACRTGQTESSSWGISISMLTEIACIAMQATRGTTSHYNVKTSFDTAIFSPMGSMVANNTVFVLVLLILFWVRRHELARPYLWGIRAGLVIFLAASGIGGVRDRPRIAFGRYQGWRPWTSDRQLEH